MCLRCTDERVVDFSQQTRWNVEVILTALLILCLLTLHCAFKSDAKFWVLEI